MTSDYSYAKCSDRAPSRESPEQHNSFDALLGHESGFTGESAIAERVRSCIDGAGRAPSEVAAHVGFSESEFLGSLDGTRQFSTVEIARLADCLGFSTHWLLTGAEDPMAVRVIACRGRVEDQQSLRDIALVYRQAYRPLSQFEPDTP